MAREIEDNLNKVGSLRKNNFTGNESTQKFPDHFT